MKKNEQLIRAVALALLTAPKGNIYGVLDMVKNQPSYAIYLHGNSKWGKLMEAWEVISKLSNTYVNDTEENKIFIDEMKIGGRSCTIKAFKKDDNGEWVNKLDKDNCWYGITWMSYHYLNEEEPNMANASDLKDAVWLTITDLALLWCEAEGYDIELHEIYK